VAVWFGGKQRSSNFEEFDGPSREVRGAFGDGGRFSLIVPTLLLALTGPPAGFSTGRTTITCRRQMGVLACVLAARTPLNPQGLTAEIRPLSCLDHGGRPQLGLFLHRHLAKPEAAAGARVFRGS